MLNYKEQLESNITMSALDMVRHSLFMAWFVPNSMIAIISPSFDSCKVVANTLWNEHASVPDWVRPKLTHKNYGQATLDNGSRLKFMHSTNHLKGVSLSMVMIDRRVDLNDEWLYSLLPSITHGAKASITFFA